MKQNIHPVYQEVIYTDVSSGYSFLTRSTAHSNESTIWEDGNTYPMVKLDISSASHPFFTGKERLLDAEGRIERFNKKYSK
jgi:large subunit ribosomal protein L31